MTSTTPLLLLLDTVLSQEADRIRDARTRIRQVVAKVNLGLAGRPLQQGANYLMQDVDLLLTAFPNLCSVQSTHDGSLPLHFAASIGDVKVATRILSQYPEAAKRPNSKGKIPLHYAAREGRVDMVSCFLSATPETAEITSKKKKLALHFAAGDGHTDVVRQLLRVYPKGASLPSAKGKLPLHFAARWGHIQIASDLLYLYPEGVRGVDWDGSLPLHDAAREGQVVMSKFLIERYPIGLSIANIRGEIPLFPAVRSGNVDLVILYLQGWALGGMHILKSVSADDNVQDWDWKIVELCLRGAVENFSNCDLMEGKEPPAVCCSVDREDYFCSMEGAKNSNKTTRVLGACCQYRKQVESPKSHHGSAKSPANQQFIASTSSSECHFAMVPRSGTCHFGSGPRGCSSRAVMEAVPRSKSPILEDGGSRSKKRPSNGEGNDRKRLRRGTGQDGEENASSTTSRQCRFIALHAALACGASSHVVRCVLKKHPTQVSEIDERGQYPLHLAVRHPGCAAEKQRSPDGFVIERAPDCKPLLKLVIEKILKVHPQAAFAPNCDEKLPLHMAIEGKADFSLIQALLQTNPSSGVDPIKTADIRFSNRPPIYMATEYNCDLSTTYLLLRGDPSVVSATARA